MTTSESTMKKVYLINETLLFEPEVRRIGPLVGYPHRAVTLHGPVSECLLLLLENNGQVVTQRVFFASVWEKQGAVVTTNALYQTISQIRKVLKSAGIEENIIKTLPKEGFKATAILKTGELNAFIQPQITSPVSVSSEESAIADATAIPGSDTPLRVPFFNSPRAYTVAGILFILSCAVLYSVMKEGKSEIETYQPIGKLNGCDVYSSWRDRAKSREMFTALTKRYDIKCNSGGTAWMTLNFAQQGSSVIVCDRMPQDKNAQCDSIIYRQQNHEE